MPLQAVTHHSIMQYHLFPKILLVIIIISSFEINNTTTVSSFHYITSITNSPFSSFSNTNIYSSTTFTTTFPKYVGAAASACVGASGGGASSGRCGSVCASGSPIMRLFGIVGDGSGNNDSCNNNNNNNNSNNNEENDNNNRAHERDAVIILKNKNNNNNNNSNNNNNNNNEYTMDIYHMNTVSSTQDEAKRILNERILLKKNNHNNNNNCILVSASTQTSGRGTSGRKWESNNNGNCHVTIGIPYDWITHFPITLLPLKIGSIVASNVIQMLLQSSSSLSPLASSSYPKSPKVNVKWPNDVLINERKVAGTLIESHQVVTNTNNSNNVSSTNWMLIGIGVNVAYAPTINTTGFQRGRLATCINDHISLDKDDDEGKDDDGDSRAKNLAVILAKDFIGWLIEDSLSSSSISSISSSSKIINEWKQYTEFGNEMELRNDTPTNNKLNVSVSDGGDGGEIVIPIDIELDGRLRVRCKRDNLERLLCVDYLL